MPVHGTRSRTPCSHSPSWTRATHMSPVPGTLLWPSRSCTVGSLTGGLPGMLYRTSHGDTKEVYRSAGIIARSASCSATQGFKWLVSVCTPVTDFSDFCGYSSHRGHPLFPLVSFQLGFSGIPESDAKTSISYLGERYTLTPFWDPFLSLFSEKVPFFPRRPGDGPISRFSSYHGRLRATLPGGSI